MPRKSRPAYDPPESPQRCEEPGCKAEGVYKAPVSKKRLNEYCWYCLDHIREHNRKWDYFSDMDRQQIEGFMKDAMTGHRPTWSREGQMRDRYDQLEKALYEFVNFGVKKSSPARAALPPKMKNALKLMEMDYPYTAAALKKQYHRMVKQYHPDLNKNDHLSEEKFKAITTGYALLLQHVKKA